MKARGTTPRILAAAGLLLVCVVAAASVVLRAWPHGNLAAAARRRAAASPVMVVPPPVSRTRGVLAPWHVGIQAGHWQIDQLPDEQYRLRGDTGAQWRNIMEAGGEHRDRPARRAPAPGRRRHR